MTLGLIVRMDKTGLGAQTQRLAQLLSPAKLLVIDSTSFNENQQYPEWYEAYNKQIIDGFPTDNQLEVFFQDIDYVMSCELFYSSRFTLLAKRAGVKSILIANPEFFDWFNPMWAMIPKPDKIVVPSQWRLNEMSSKFNAEYIPTPIFKSDFADSLKTNLARTGKKHYLFINGRSAVHDRNGLTTLYKALEHSETDFTITIKAQHDIPMIEDQRIIYDFENPESSNTLYSGYDALILPRRYAGQSLPMCEALSCGLPVVMPDVDPNNKVLPEEWLIKAHHMGSFKTRTTVDIYSADIRHLARILDTLDTSLEAKQKAVAIAEQYDADNLKDKYKSLFT